MPAEPSSVNLEEWFDRLEDSGYRLTKPLRVVAEVMAKNSYCTLSPTEVYDLGREHYPKLGLVTVYRTLEKLEEVGVIQRVHQAGGCNSYIAAPSGHQHLLICRNCGRVEYFQGIDLTDLVSRVEAKSYYSIQDHWLQLIGLYKSCQ
ncbi:MAG: transcriptional repressor [Anaerolineae bacterium]|nr:transcriptional repressor [Anaerolineae bacterium]